MSEYIGANRLQEIEQAIYDTQPKRGGPDPAIRMAAFGMDDILWLLQCCTRYRTALEQIAAIKPGLAELPGVAKRALEGGGA